MDYQKHYNLLISSAKGRTNFGYTEKHHIIPRCLGGDNSKENLVLLTAREHFIAHALLAKIYENSEVSYKLSAAFNKMCQDGHQGRRYTSRLFDMARRLFSENHPAKRDEIRKKISDGVKQTQNKDWWASHRVKKELRVCGCGCEEEFECMPSSNKRFIKGHYSKEEKLESSKKTSESLKTFIESLTEAEKEERRKKSLGSVDHVKRGKAISAAKRGKKTNQVELEEEKYGCMSEEDFVQFIMNRTPGIQKRMKRRRDAYINRINN